MENILLTDFNTPFETVPFSQINNEDFGPAIEKGITLAKEEIEAIKNNPDTPNFENTVLALEAVGKGLDQASTVLFNSALSVLPASELTYSIPGMIPRRDNNKPAITSSFTAFALAPGVLNTTTPRSVQTSTGTLFTPAPARPTAISDGVMSLAVNL